jgi:hypothetical protein
MLGFIPSAGFVIKRDETNVVQQWFFMQRWNNLRELIIWKVLGRWNNGIESFAGFL